MKLVDKIASCSHPYFSFEFFPPKTEQGFSNLLTRIERLAGLNPIAVSITWGAGGSTRERTVELASWTQEKQNLDTIMHLTCTNMEKGAVDATLKTAKEHGIQNILALRGDPPRGEEYWIPCDPQFNHAIDLVSYIRSQPEFGSHFCIGVAAYPDGHPDHECTEDEELEFLKQKVDAGADFIFTQLFYDVDGFVEWVGKVRAKGISVPIIPGIMLIQTYASFLRMVKLCGTRVPQSVSGAIEPIKHDDAKVKDFGVQLATSMIKQLIASDVVRGVHFCTLNLEMSVRRVLEALEWTGQSGRDVNRLIAETDELPVKQTGLLISPETAASTVVVHPPSEQVPPDAGKGVINHPTTWDEFPNGRFGDSKSPAYGAAQPWDGAIASSKQEATAKWGQPRTEEDITKLFLAHLHAELNSTPFCDTPLSAESALILPSLERLTKAGWWTVGSQPAVDAAPSEDDVLGWGPTGGYVFQKAFVEFFATKEDVDWLEHNAKTAGKGLVTYFAGNADGEWATNDSGDAANAVTWGVFPGQEIAQTTIIERESFLAWKDEAFGIWHEWSLFYPPDSLERTFLERMRQERWLVTIVHHDFKNPNGLWDFWDLRYKNNTITNGS